MEGLCVGYPNPTFRRLPTASVVVVVVIVSALGVSAFLPDGDLDALRSEAFAQPGALANTGELLGRVHLEDVAEARGEDRRLPSVDNGAGVALLGAWRCGRRPNIDKRES